MYKAFRSLPDLTPQANRLAHGFRGRDGLHVYFDNMDIITSHSWNGDFTGSPCQPFVGMSFAVLVRYLPEYHNTKMQIALGLRQFKAFGLFPWHLEAKGMIVFYQYEWLVGLAVYDYTVSATPNEDVKHAPTTPGEMVWYELRFITATEVQLYRNGVLRCRNTHISQEILDKTPKVISFPGTDINWVQGIELHYTTIRDGLVDKIFPPPIIDIFWRNYWFYFMRGATVTLVGKNTEENTSRGVVVGLKNYYETLPAVATLKTALDKEKNVIVIRRGIAHATFYCNDEHYTISRPYSKVEWVVIVANFRPTNIVLHLQEHGGAQAEDDYLGDLSDGELKKRT